MRRRSPHLRRPLEKHIDMGAMQADIHTALAQVDREKADTPAGQLVAKPLYPPEEETKMGKDDQWHHTGGLQGPGGRCGLVHTFARGNDAAGQERQRLQVALTHTSYCITACTFAPGFAPTFDSYSNPGSMFLMTPAFFHLGIDGA